LGKCFHSSNNSFSNGVCVGSFIISVIRFFGVWAWLESADLGKDLKRAELIGDLRVNGDPDDRPIFSDILDMRDGIPIRDPVQRLHPLVKRLPSSGPNQVFLDEVDLLLHPLRDPDDRESGTIINPRSMQFYVKLSHLGTSR
jgi:hypothetical protein